MPPRPTFVVAGVGNGAAYITDLRAICSRIFAKAGYNVALVARNADSLKKFAEEIKGTGGEAAAFPIANYSPSSIQSAFGSIKSQWPESPLRVALFNTAFGVWKPFLQVTPEEVQESVDTNIVAAFAFSREAIIAFKDLDLNDKGKRGTLLFTGATASLRGNTTTSAFAAGKFAVRALSQSLAKEFGKENIHVAHAIIDGGILTDRSASRTPKEKLENPDALLSPESIGNSYLYLVNQDRSAWTWELDPRQYNSKSSFVRLQRPVMKGPDGPYTRPGFVFNLCAQHLGPSTSPPMLSKRVLAATLSALLSFGAAATLPMTLVLIALDPATNATLGYLNGFGNFSATNPLDDYYPYNTNVDATTGLQHLAGYSSCTVATPGWTYVGCALDQGSPRLLSGYSESVADNSIEHCLNLCASKGYTLAGTEYTYECYCDNQYEFTYTAEPDTDCSLPCSGNPAEVCGGYSRLSIYSTNGSPTTGVALDCYDGGTPLLFSEVGGLLSLDSSTGTAFSVATTADVGGSNPFGYPYGVPLLIGDVGAVDIVLQVVAAQG
ncbi:hypothetical protein HWV62_12705 [Athelia sp. TMB]|nr:hypothetical protein HWV62_12705 [Athelia sp. TMB]